MMVKSKILLVLFLFVCTISYGQIGAPPTEETLASLQIYDKQNRPLRTFLSKKETYAQRVPLSQISPNLILATLAAEDRRFYTHHGIDVRAILRAMWQNIRGKEVVSGASTITQQVVRMQHPRPKTWRGKWAEAWDAIKLDHHYSKDEILEQYFSLLELGNQTQGVEAAARYYFKLPAKELSLAQSALLAGLIQAPSRLNPLNNPQGALSRRNRVLTAMLKNGFITQEQFALAQAEPLGIEIGARPFDAPHFVRRISQIAPHYTQIYSTLDKDIQLYAEKALKTHLAKLTDNHVTNGAVIVLDNVSGDILAYVGSVDFYDKEHAGEVDGIMARRQPGSTLKPFVYALALQHGLTAASLLADEDTFFEGGFRPRNYDEKFHGQISLRKALANSYNIPVIKAVEPLGAASVLEELHQFGFDSLNRPADFYGLGIALGGGEVTLLELANAYATLARGGILRPVVAARKPYLTFATPSRRVLPAETSYIITDILADNTARAEAFGLNSPLYFPFPAAAKTGTSKDYKDNFAVGYTPRLTVAVWVGNFDGTPMQKVSGISGAAPVLHDVLMYANAKYTSGEFERPQGVLSARICSQSGLLAGENCTHTQEEIFTQDTIPHQKCDGTHRPQNELLQIIFPVAGDIYQYDPALPPAGQALHIQTKGAKGACHWKLNNEELSQTGTEFWWPLQKGKFDLQVECGNEHAHTHFSVL